MLVFNDINKPHRTSHLHYVICSVPQVARESSDMELSDGEHEMRESVERISKFHSVEAFSLIL